MTSKAKGWKKAKTLNEFIDQRISIEESGCWEWTSTLDTDGYGRAIGKWYREYKKSGAHQLSYICYRGPIPAGEQVCHKCDNPSCVNPDHLFLGSPQVNMTDKVLKFRQPVKLTPEQVLEIRTRYESGLFTQAELAPDYNVTEESIRCVINRKSWRHI